MIEHDSLKSLKQDLRGERKLGFVRARSTNEFDMSSIAGSMEVNAALADFLVVIIEHTEDIFDSAPVRLETDYNQRIVGEVDSQVFPNFPIIRERAFYEKECKVEDEKSLTFMCENFFPSHIELTPGLMIMTCAW